MREVKKEKGKRKKAKGVSDKSQFQIPNPKTQIPNRISYIQNPKSKITKPKTQIVYRKSQNLLSLKKALKINYFSYFCFILNAKYAKVTKKIHQFKTIKFSS